MLASGRDHRGHLVIFCRPPARCFDRMELLSATMYPLVGGSSGVASKNFWREDLKLDNVGLRVVCAGIAFQRRGPRTAKEASYCC